MFRSFPDEFTVPPQGMESTFWTIPIWFISFHDQVSSPFKTSEAVSQTIPSVLSIFESTSLSFFEESGGKDQKNRTV